MAVVEKPTQLIRIAAQISQPKKQYCPNCEGDGWIVRDVEGMGRKAFPCECQISARVARRIPALYRNARLADFKETTIERLKEFFGKPDSLGLLIFGHTGVGKTYLAAAITRELLEIGQEILFLEVSRLYSELRECMKRNESEESLIAQYVHARWLVLDDFGAGALTDFERRYALDLLNRRANAKRKTILTTNLRLEEIAEKLDERIASRLSGFDQIEAQGKDRRAKRGS
jgi:DNA replication protein DnaC